MSATVTRPRSPNRTYECSVCRAPYLRRDEVQIPDRTKPRTIVCDECVARREKR